MIGDIHIAEGAWVAAEAFESVTNVWILSMGQMRAKACPPSLEESAMMTTRRARATMRRWADCRILSWSAWPMVVPKTVANLSLGR